MLGKKVAAVVTVEHYSDKVISNLIGSHNDGSELSFALKSIGYDTHHVHQRRDDEVIEIIEDLVHDLGEGDLFLFYFAGHGFIPDGTSDQLLLCPSAKLRYLERGYDHNSIRLSFIDDILTRPGLDRMFILDACRTHVRKGRGGSNSLSTEQHLRDIGNRTVETTGSYAVLNSCSKNQQACELPGRRQGLFTAALTDVLRDFHSSGKGLLADSELKQLVASRMKHLALEEGMSGNQDPAFRSGGPCSIVLITPQADYLVNDILDSTARTTSSKQSGVQVKKHGCFVIETEPPGADVWVAGKYKGKTPVRLKLLESGDYMVRLEKAFREKWEEEVTYNMGSKDAVLSIPMLLASGVREYDGRFLKKESNGIILDTETGLEWLIGHDKDTNQYNALSWSEDLGNGWRLPGTEELRCLLDSGINRYSWGPFENSGWWIWTSELHRDNLACAWGFNFQLDCVDWGNRDYSNGARAFTVRSSGKSVTA